MYSELRDFLFETIPRENGCFLLANHYSTKRGKNVTMIVGLIKPEPNSWNYTTEHSLGPSSSFINHAVVMADDSNLSLVFVHTHPSSFHPPMFSSIDEESNKRLFANLSRIIPGRPFGSIVLSMEGAYGIVFYGRKSESISTFEISGNVISELQNVINEPDPAETSTLFDRQVRMIGKTCHKKLQKMTVSVIGVGGTGSSVAVQLARMGIKKLRLIDRDIIDETNIPRVYGSKLSDMGKPKVNVLKKHILSFSKTKVEALHTDITETDALPYLIDSDVIFSCTDNLTSRSILNDVSIQYYIPLIDVGVRIHFNKDDSLEQAVTKVQLVTPDTACLWCTGTLDGKLILQESFSEDEKMKLAEEGYYEAIEKQPSVISMTTMVASMAVNRFLSLIGALGENHDARTQIELKSEFMLSDTPEIKADCTCHERRGIGNNRRIVN